MELDETVAAVEGETRELAARLEYVAEVLQRLPAARGAAVPGDAAYSATPVVNGYGGMTYTLYVPDSAIPSMVGRGGVIIKEMQQQTGATIKISQKGEYAPGTMNRIVTITGTPQACLLYTSPSPRDGLLSRMPSSA